MKTRSAFFPALILLSLSVPVLAHPGHESNAPAYLAFWSGVQPKTGGQLKVSQTTPGFWHTAFISKYRLVGVALPNLAP